MPKKEKIVLKDYQKKVIDKMSDPDRSGLLVYHELGSGKTITAIEAARKLNMKSTVVTPASLRENFIKEVDKVGANRKNYNVTSYEKYQRNTEDFTNNDMLVLDEAHRIRNSETKRSQSIQRTLGSYKKRMLLTGTPIQNKPSEIAPLINVAAGRSVFPTSEKAFNKIYLPTVTVQPSVMDYIFKGDRPYKKVVPSNLDKFRSNVRGLVDYHKNTDTAEFPSVKTHISKVMMTKDQADTYNYFEGKLSPAVRYKIKRGLAPDKKDAMALNSFLSATRQISNSDSKFTSTKVHGVSPKITAIADRVSKTTGPSLVYSNYLDSGVRPLSKLLSKKGVSNSVYTGELNDVQKSQMVKDYNTGRVKALLVSSSGGEGLDLKNTRAVHIMEPHWNEPKIDQVIGRAVRYRSHAGLTPEKRNVDVYKYLADIPNKQTADEYLYEMSKKKTEINNKFLNILKQEGSK